MTDPSTPPPMGAPPRLRFPVTRGLLRLIPAVLRIATLICALVPICVVAIITVPLLLVLEYISEFGDPGPDVYWPARTYQWLRGLMSNLAPGWGADILDGCVLAGALVYTITIVATIAHC